MPSPTPSWLAGFFETGVVPCADEEEEEEVCSHHADTWIDSIVNTL
jgi:hypothetical protein